MQPTFQITWDSGFPSPQTVASWAALAAATGLADSTLRQRLSQRGGAWARMRSNPETGNPDVQTITKVSAGASGAPRKYTYRAAKSGGKPVDYKSVGEAAQHVGLQESTLRHYFTITRIVDRDAYRVEKIPIAAAETTEKQPPAQARPAALN